MASPVVTCGDCGTKNRVPVASSGSPRCAQCHTDLSWLVDAGDADFDAAVDTNRLVLVDLWAPWCGPCRMVAPVVEIMARDFAGRLKVVKVNVDEAPRVAQRFEAMSIPMLVFLRDGQLVETIVGAQPEPAMRQAVEALLT
ncbi:MAG: thioredoxin [Acidimicrobiales bacterium]